MKSWKVLFVILLSSCSSIPQDTTKAIPCELITLPSYNREAAELFDDIAVDSILSLKRLYEVNCNE